MIGRVIAAAALAGASVVSAAPLTARTNGCSASARIAGAELLLKAFTEASFSAGAADLVQLPFDPAAKINIDANGLAPINVAVDGKTAVEFLTSTLNVFGSVSGSFSDDAAKGTTTLHAKVYLRALGLLTVPVPVNVDFQLYYDPVDCVIDAINAVTDIPTTIAGLKIEPAILPLILDASPLIPTPLAPISLS